MQLARQAAQITAGVPGVCVRWCSYVLAGALILAGDLADADDVCAAALARSRDAGDVFNQWSLLPAMVLLDVFAGRFEHAVAHLREGLQIAMRTGGWFELNHYLDGCGYLCAATGRPAEALTMWTASAALLGPGDLRLRRPSPDLRAARQALGTDRTRAAEDRGAAMSLAAAAEYALMLTAAPGAQQAPARWPSSVPGSANWSPWSPRAAPTPRSPPSCSSASARSARTWTGSGTRPAAGAAPT